jgi:formylmethanofuran dehydrogenase subunit E
MIESDDLVGLLHKTAQLHGHHCVGSAMGVIAANHAMKTMRIVRNTGMEHLISVVETNSCFSDARAWAFSVLVGTTEPNPAACLSLSRLGDLPQAMPELWEGV